MEKKISPGFSLLTWTSMNIDGFLHRFRQVCVANHAREGQSKASTYSANFTFCA